MCKCKARTYNGHLKKVANGYTGHAYSGVFSYTDTDKRPTMEHADYPHQPGTLYDCPACETYCYCEYDNGVCVFFCVAHAIQDEAENHYN